MDREFKPPCHIQVYDAEKQHDVCAFCGKEWELGMEFTVCFQAYQKVNEGHFTDPKHKIPENGWDILRDLLPHIPICGVCKQHCRSIVQSYLIGAMRAYETKTPIIGAMAQMLGGVVVICLEQHRTDVEIYTLNVGRETITKIRVGKNPSDDSTMRALMEEANERGTIRTVVPSIDDERPINEDDEDGEPN